MLLQWTLARLNQLSPVDVHDMLSLRSEVFVVEQACVFQDPDGADLSSTHLLGRSVEGQLAAVLRIVDPGVKYAQPSIGRVVCAPALRGRGLGRELFAQGVLHCRTLWPGQGIRISAQARLQNFYEAHGFVVQGPAYLEDGIPHLEMFLKPEVQA